MLKGKPQAPSGQACAYCRQDPVPPHGHARNPLPSVCAPDRGRDQQIQEHLLGLILQAPSGAPTTGVLTRAAIAAGLCYHRAAVARNLERLEAAGKIRSTHVRPLNGGATRTWSVA